MKTIGLVTYFGNNYGGCLQAYAMQRYLEINGYQAEIIDYTYNPSGSVFKRYSSALKRLRHPVIYARQRKIIHDNIINFEIRARAFQLFRDRYLKLTPKQYRSFDSLMTDPPVFDVFLAGSDQIWNPTFYGRCNPVYYLDFVPGGKKRVSYASSIGLSAVPGKYTDEMARLLRPFHAVSVRENKGAEIIRKLTGKDVPVVLDPTLLLTAAQWDDVMPSLQRGGDYIFCYLFSDLGFVHEIKEHVRSKTNLKIVSLPFSTREMAGTDEIIYDATPADFVNLIRHAKLVLTDSFHATAFSINLQVPFYTLLRQKSTDKSNMNSRIFNILNMCGLKDRLLTADNYRSVEIGYDMDFSSCQKILDEQRKASRMYLERVLE